MKNLKKLSFLILAVIAVLVIFFSYDRVVKSRAEAGLIFGGTNSLINSQQLSINGKPIDRVQIYYFHRTQRCSTCRTIGRLTGEVVSQQFPEQAASGVIYFQEVNVELPENRALAKKFGATGPSLFINVISGERENISQDMTIWRLVNNEDQFKEYLTNKLASLLAK